MKTSFTAFLIMLSIIAVAQSNSSEVKKEPLYGSYDKITPATQQLANEGNTKAMYKIARIYQNQLSYTDAFYWYKKAAENGHIKAWFNLGMLFKKGEGVTMDYTKAYECFNKAAEKKDPSGEYAKGYMLFKGLGCKQNYEQAIELFRKGVYQQRVLLPGKMYLLGICFRNGYGVEINTDSARYWLEKSASVGYSFANDELMSEDGENSNDAEVLLQKIDELQRNKKRIEENKYTPVYYGIPASEIEGNYEGYLVQRDWSGKYIIGVTKLQMEINYKNGKINGEWNENKLNIPITANLTKDGLVFRNMQYAKKDHYSPIVSVLFDFEKANLQILKEGDSVFLHGNLQLFSPDRKEPEKPIEISLIKITSSRNDSIITLTKPDGTPESLPDLKAYPNPFSDLVNIEFNLTENSIVNTSLLNTEGKTVYNIGDIMLKAGTYILPLRPNLPNGIYILRLVTNNKIKTTKLVKL